MRISRGLTRVAVVAAALTPVAALASHDFPDVPDAAFYHASVGNILDAGVTAGCGGGNYCPDNPVTRGEMAVFLDRVLGNPTPVVDAATAQDAATLGGHGPNAFLPAGRVDFNEADWSPSYFTGAYTYPTGDRVLSLSRITDGATITSIEVVGYGLASDELRVIRQPYTPGTPPGFDEVNVGGGPFDLANATLFTFSAADLQGAGSTTKLETLLVDHDAARWYIYDFSTSPRLQLLRLTVFYTLPA